MRLQNVCKSFGEKQVLKDFSYDFPKQGIVFVEGASGTGKTTLLNILAGLCKVDSGEVELEPVSYLFQEDRLLDWLSVLQNVMCVTKNTPEDQKRCVEILSDLGLDKELDSMPDSLSGGMRRRVAIARTLVYDTSVVLLDEPFKGLDKKTLESTIETIKENTLDKLVLIVSHEADKKYFYDYEQISI